MEYSTNYKGTAKSYYNKLSTSVVIQIKATTAIVILGDKKFNLKVSFTYDAIILTPYEDINNNLLMCKIWRHKSNSMLEGKYVTLDYSDNGHLDLQECKDNDLTFYKSLIAKY